MFGKDKESQRQLTVLQRGQLAETAVLNRFVELGYEVLIPWGNYYAYDLAYVQPGKSGLLESKPPELIRVQVKLARMSADGNYFEFHTSTKNGGKRMSYGGKIELFAVYCVETGKVYVVWVDQAPKMKMILRLSKVQVGEERKYIKWAKDYEL